MFELKPWLIDANAQVRAYIAASRRSDRSLEARVESARRASEIHKRRTGRSLRVTEQDVINEEMYEEEDDDLPMQYRRLTAHLQTGSADFNRRLAAYLTNQVAMRSAVEQMANNPYGGQQGGHPLSYQQPRQNMFQSPMAQQPQHQHQMPQSTATQGGYRPAPYPSPHHPGYRNSHSRAYSTAVMPAGKVQTPPTPNSSHLDHRRMSTPAAIPPPINTNGLKSDSNYARQTQSAQVTQAPFNPYWQDMSPFTTLLPPESQQMLAGAPGMDMNDHFSGAMMHGSEQFMSNPYYPWHGDVQQGIKGMPVHPSAYQGMSATLAPSALSTQAESLSATPSSNAPPTFDGSMSAGMLDPLGLNHLSMSAKDMHSPHSLPSGQNTPGESFWSNFVQDGGWNDETGLSTC